LIIFIYHPFLHLFIYVRNCFFIVFFSLWRRLVFDFNKKYTTSYEYQLQNKIIIKLKQVLLTKITPSYILILNKFINLAEKGIR